RDRSDAAGKFGERQLLQVSRGKAWSLPLGAQSGPRKLSHLPRGARLNQGGHAESASPQALRGMSRLQPRRQQSAGAAKQPVCLQQRMQQLPFEGSWLETSLRHVFLWIGGMED